MYDVDEVTADYYSETSVRVGLYAP